MYEAFIVLYAVEIIVCIIMSLCQVFANWVTFDINCVQLAQWSYHITEAYKNIWPKQMCECKSFCLLWVFACNLLKIIFMLALQATCTVQKVYFSVHTIVSFYIFKETCILLESMLMLNRMLILVPTLYSNV